MKTIAFVFSLMLGFALSLHQPATAAELLPMPPVKEDGLHHQPWIQDSFLNLQDDLAEAREQGKTLVVIWEQLGCPYCKRMHEVNFRIPRFNKYIEDNFYVLQLNMWGDREVTDFDGQSMSEKNLANKWGILYTPTIQFFPDSAPTMSGKEVETVRVPGYFKPFHQYFLFRYAHTKGYVEQPNFQRWLSAIADRLEEGGIHYDLWSDELPHNLPDDL